MFELQGYDATNALVRVKRSKNFKDLVSLIPLLRLKGIVRVFVMDYEQMICRFDYRS